MSVQCSISNINLTANPKRFIYMESQRVIAEGHLASFFKYMEWKIEWLSCENVAVFSGFFFFFEQKFYHDGDQLRMASCSSATRPRGAQAKRYFGRLAQENVLAASLFARRSSGPGNYFRRASPHPG